MTKRNKIIYWVATSWLALGMLSTGIVQLLKQEAVVENITQLGYPVYFLTLLSIWKILGVVAVLMPKSFLLKEWAYAGFFFVLSGATLSRIVAGNAGNKIAPSLLLLSLTLVSWYCRPADRKPILVKHATQIV